MAENTPQAAPAAPSGHSANDPEPWPPEYGTCGHRGCQGELQYLPPIPGTHDEPAEPAWWECPKCGHGYPVGFLDPMEIDYPNQPEE